MRIGVFGGTFDPPHIGHLILADEAFYQLKLDRLLWVLTPDPPHKQGHPITPMPLRLDLVHAAIDSNPKFELSTVEIDRPGPHYAVDTVRLLGLEFPAAQLFYIIGGDSLHDLPMWYHPIEFLSLIDGLGVLRRPDDEIDLIHLEEAIPGIRQKINWIRAPLLEISSSQIRERVEKGQGYHYYLPEKVLSLIRSHGLYRKNDLVQPYEISDETLS